MGSEVTSILRGGSLAGFSTVPGSFTPESLLTSTIACYCIRHGAMQQDFVSVRFRTEKPANAVVEGAVSHSEARPDPHQTQTTRGLTHPNVIRSLQTACGAAGGCRGRALRPPSPLGNRRLPWIRVLEWLRRRPGHAALFRQESSMTDVSRLAGGA
jgi:hypothetical protein